MDPRGLIAVVVGLVLLAFGGFYFALGLHAKDALVPPAPGPPRLPALPRRPLRPLPLRPHAGHGHLVEH